MDLTGLTKKLAVAPGAVVPRVLQHRHVHAHAITRDDLEDDVAGINASLDLIRRTRGGPWPTEPVTREGNYVDLVWHEAEFRDGKSYTYVLTDHDRGYIGCLYLYPLGVRGPLSEELLQHDVDISWWVTPRAHAAGLYTAAFEAIQDWIADQLPFTTPFYSNVEITAPPTGWT
jgi:RimJ/RimL family protein N-acetyltransferase